MTDLTEQWKKGELPDGFYWLEFQDGEVLSATFSIQHGFICCDSLCDDENIKQILKEMPSYEEMQNINKSVNDLMAANIKLVEENTKLKELLKEVLRHELSLKEISELTRKICQALGEDK